MKDLSRRAFLKRGGLTLGAISVLSQILDNAPAFAQDLPALDEANPTAMALGYKHDASKVDTAKFPKRATAEGAKQFCHNCMFYTQGGLKVAGKEGEWGKCTIFPTAVVASAGWCNTWAIKPGTTL